MATRRGVYLLPQVMYGKVGRVEEGPSRGGCGSAALVDVSFVVVCSRIKRVQLGFLDMMEIVSSRLLTLYQITQRQDHIYLRILQQ